MASKSSELVKNSKRGGLGRTNKPEPEPTPEEIAEYAARAKEIRDSWSEEELLLRMNGGKKAIKHSPDIKHYVYDGRTVSFEYVGTE